MRILKLKMIGFKMSYYGNIVSMSAKMVKRYTKKAIAESDKGEWKKSLKYLDKADTFLTISNSSTARMKELYAKSLCY